MPLVALAYAAVAAGIAVGLSAWPLAPLVLFGAAAVLAAARARDVRAAALALCAVAGALGGRVARDADARCRAAAVRVGAVEAVLDVAARPGETVRGTALVGRCRLRLVARVEHGHAPAGGRVRLRGELTATDRGVLARHAQLAPLGGRDRRLAVRDRAGRAIDAAFGDRAPLARALLIADADGLEPALRDRWADAGLVHMLSVSGLHVAIIATALELLASVLRLPARARPFAVLACVAAYVALLGAPAPALRSGVMLGVDVVARALQRPTSPWAAVALGALVPLAEPRTLLDLGYQLSVVGIAGLAAARALGGRLPMGRGVRRRLAGELLAGVVATVATAPIVAWHFGRLSLVGPLANVVAAPLVAVLQPALFLALALAPAPAAARFVGDATRPLSAALDAVAGAFAAVPGGAIAVAPTYATAVLCALAAALALAACSARAGASFAAAALGCLGAAVWLPLLPARGRHVELHLLDVGQGDAVAVRTSRGRWILVDAGRVWLGGDAGRRTVVPYLRRRGGALAAFVLTHPHADHVGGAATVIRTLRPAAYWDPAFALGSDTYRRSLEAARAAGVPWRRVRPGDSVVVDDVVTTFLAPDSAWTASLADANLASTVASVRVGRVRFLLVGDAEAEEEEWLLARAAADPRVAAALRADVLKVGHHGSATSTTPDFLAAVAPRVALVSVGAGNSYGHPSPDVLRRLRRVGAEVLRTDQAGPVVVRTDGRSLTVHAHHTSWHVPPRRAPLEGR